MSKRPRTHIFERQLNIELATYGLFVDIETSELVGFDLFAVPDNSHSGYPVGASGTDGPPFRLCCYPTELLAWCLEYADYAAVLVRHGREQY